MAKTSLIMLLSSLLAQSILAVPTSLLHSRASAPDFVTKYAPLVYLFPGENYFPSDIGAQLQHTKPEDNFTAVANPPNPLTLDNLDQLNANDGANIYLTSVDDITTNPAWLTGVKPDGSGKTDGATSCAIIVNDHGNGVVDAFYMYFYAYNWGGRVLEQDVDDHVGDWEHNMIRFNNGAPSQVWYSQHSFGQAFTYDALEKQGDRIITYSGNGSHANYATTGQHLNDHTDKGLLWDPIQASYFYSYDASSKAFSAYDGTSPTAWLSYIGKWGDEEYPDSDPRQHKILGIDASARFTSGPTGPEDKQLNRTDVCPTGGACVISPVRFRKD